MSREELLAHCSKLYASGGTESLSYANLSRERGLYPALYRNGLNQKTVLAELNVLEEYRDTRGEFLENAWGWNRVIAEAKSVTGIHGFLPPAGWFQQNKMSSLVAAVYALGKTWEDLREQVGEFEGSSFVQSRNGMRWRSHPEASLSNFLYARGVKHKKGEKYPEDFSYYASQGYGYYDAHFLSSKNCWIDVEIWGEKPNGSDAEHYSRKRREKENFNARFNSNFVGIEFRDCFDDSKLAKILRPYIGLIEPYVFELPHDQQIQSTHWSNADELIEYCRVLAGQQPDGKFPTEEWLRKRGKWEDRPGPAYNTVSIYIKKWVGGIRVLRDILGQSENSTTKWDKKVALRALGDFVAKYGVTPNSVRADYGRGKGGYSHDEAKEAARLAFAVRKHVGPISVALEQIGVSVGEVRRV